MLLTDMVPIVSLKKIVILDWNATHQAALNERVHRILQPAATGQESFSRFTVLYSTFVNPKSNGDVIFHWN